MTSSVGRNDPCPCGSGKKFKKCCLDGPGHTAANDVEQSVPAPRGRDELRLFVETSRGVFARRIPSASPLRTDLSHGDAAEAATHDAAAVWGLPDFVYQPETEAVGSGTRELGDGIIVVGNLGIVVQVKSREVPSGDSEKEARWLQKKASTGLSQGAGTIRRLQRTPTDLTNLRGTTVAIDGNDYRWLVVVVLDHPDPPEDVTPPVEDARHPSVVLLRRDWEFLFDQLKSTHAVAHYFQRVAGESIALGEEPVRYYDLAQADAEAPPEEFPAELVRGCHLVSGPLLPMEPAASDDRDAHTIVRAILEDIAVTRLTTASEKDRLRVLAELDRLPVTRRALIGRFVLDAMNNVSKHFGANDTVWQLRSVRGKAGHAHLAFGACNRPYDDELSGLFGLWTQLRHHDVSAVRGDAEDLTTVAVLLTPRTDGRRPWDTTVAAVSGEVSFDSDELEQLRELWPYPEAA